MMALDRHIDEQLAEGRAYLTREALLDVFDLKPDTLTAALTRLIAKKRLANPHHGFYLILRPEDRISAPEPTRWIDALMNYLKIDYRVSLLRAAAQHGSSHQAQMIFQVVAPKQLRPISLGRHRIQFLFQAPAIFASTNRPEWLDQLKTDTGYAKLAGIELTLLDSMRYYRKASGMGGVAQIVKDLGGRANPAKLAKTARHYENASVRRLGYLMELGGHARQAKVLEPFVARARGTIPLDPSVKPVSTLLDGPIEKNGHWKLDINTPVEIDF